MIRIICVGKIKEKYLSFGIEEYLKRISKYTKIEILELTDFDGDINTVLKKERDLILKNIKDKSYIVTLEIDGNQLDSISFSKKIDSILLNNSNILFIMGGSYGLHQDVKNISDYSLSFSKFTFPHQLFRIILLEQIYRAFKILNNESYHK